LTLSLALAAPTAHAMGLGQLEVKSGLNQPLIAEIPIISASPSELEKLDVRLASPEAFARVGLDRPMELTANLQFSVGKNSRGQPVIRVSTPSRFAEPVLSFLIEADWGRGTVTREYTALIDPPYIAAAIVRPMETPAMVMAPPPPMPEAPPPTPVTTEPAETMAAAEAPPATVLPPPPQPAYEPPPPPPEPIVVAPEPQVQPPPPEPEPAPAPEPEPVPPPAPAPEPIAPAPAPASPGQFGPVAQGQTLWSIANSVKPDPALSVNQMMLAILRANPEAFDQDNINQLKSGSVLRIPDRDEVSRLSQEQAAALVHEQAAAWRAPRAPVPQPAEVTSTQPAASEPAASEPAASPPVASAPVAKPRRTRLEIVPPAGKSSARSVQSGAAAGAGGTELRAQLTQAREELAASKAESTELRSRVTELEKQQADRQRLIDLQNSQLKDLQDKLAQLEAQQTAAATAPPTPTPAPPAASSTVTTATPTASLPATKPAAKPVPKPAAPAPAVEPEAAWYSNLYVIIGGALLLIGGLVFALRRFTRKSDNGDAPSRRISEDEALRASLAATRKKPTAPPKAEPAPVPAPAPVVAAVPAADKEEQNLAAAVRSRPQDLEAHLSLLRYYHSHGDAVAYESAAQAMRMQVASTTDPRWREAVVMGAALLPGHPLFSQAGWNAPTFNESEPAARAPEAAPVVAAKPAPKLEPTIEAPSIGEDAIEVSDDEWNRAMGTHVEPEPVVAPVKVAPAPPPPPASAAAPPEPDMSFAAAPMDIHRSEAEVLAEDEASATRIELAKAYLDIGDFEGARSMLEEVMSDGGPAAKSVAERILKEIG
jgi:pilus assembly protein FimV